MDLTTIDIHTLLPQQPPFVMVQTLVHFDMDKTVTRTVVTDDNIFTSDGHFTAPGIIENIAQTCATRIGYINKYIKQSEIALGVIGAMRNLEILRLPRTGEVIHTSILTVHEVFGMTLVEATVCVDDEVIARGEMKIAVNNDTPVVQA